MRHERRCFRAVSTQVFSVITPEGHQKVIPALQPRLVSLFVANFFCVEHLLFRNKREMTGWWTEILYPCLKDVTIRKQT